MISPFYKNLTPVVIALVCFDACTKENSDPASILMSKAWFPYQVEVKTVDSNRTVVTDNVTGEQKETYNVSKTDTVFLTYTCEQNSLYQFKANGVEIITDLCAYNPGDVFTKWSITQTGELSFSQFATGAGPITGFLTEINRSHFVLNAVRGNQYPFGYSVDANGNQVNTYDKLMTTAILTFKSR
jgi:hypothetical protein